MKKQYSLCFCFCFLAQLKRGHSLSLVKKLGGTENNPRNAAEC